jgi:hypothetical protein
MVQVNVGHKLIKSNILGFLLLSDACDHKTGASSQQKLFWAYLFPHM